MRWAYALVVLAVVFVFAIWPLHQHADSFWSPGRSCGSAMRGSGHCDHGVVNHRRILLLELGGGALLVGLVGLELAFGARRKRESPENEPAASMTTAAGLSSDALDKLERLVRLRDSGALTEDEFAANKAELLRSR